MPKPWKHGDRITPERLNEMQRAAPPRLGPGLIGGAQGNEVRIALARQRQGSAGAFELRRMKVTALHEEYLECILVDGDDTEYPDATENVAKPKALRLDGDGTYAVDDVILAGQPIWGGTGVTVADVPLCWEVISPSAGAKWKADT